MIRHLARIALFAAALGIAATSSASAQRNAAPAKAPPSLVGTWTGTARVPLGDSTLVVPVMYTFTDGPNGVGGTAVVPGQGSGIISGVSRDARTLKFRVTAQQGQPPKTALLEHDTEFTADNVIEGMINLDNKPVAKLKLTLAPKQ